MKYMYHFNRKDLLCLDSILWNLRRKFAAFAPLCSSIERVQCSEDAAAEKGNETALLYVSSLLCLRQKRFIPGVSGRTEKTVATRKRPIERSDEGKYTTMRDSDEI